MEPEMRRNALALLILVATLPLIQAKAQTPAQSPSRSVLTAEGSGEAQAKPDYARITAMVSARAQSLDGAVQSNQQLVTRANAVLQSLKEEGVEIEKSNFSLANDHPRPVTPQEPPGPPSFTAMTSFSLKANRIERLNAVVGKLASSGLFELSAVSFEVSDNHQALDEARRKAVADARHRAEVLADAAGVRLDDIATIADGNAAPRVLAFEVARQASLVIPPSTLSFGASVTISWHISPRP
jgi:uncharacterized protein YggE